MIQFDLSLLYMHFKLGKLLVIQVTWTHDLALISPIHELFSLKFSPFLIDKLLELFFVNTFCVCGKQLVQGISKCGTSLVC